MSTVEQMKLFMEPKSVALLGVSRSSGEGTHNILEHLLSYGYKGRMYPVNPNAAEILGVKAYPRVSDVHEPIDLAVINLPRNVVPGIVAECRDTGIKAVVISTQGFADASDEEGKQLQRQLDEIIKRDGIRVLGPNSLGIVNPFINFSSSFAEINMQKIPVGVISQTGSLLVLFPNLIGKAIDIANACDVNFNDALDYFEQDPETRVIAIHIEGMQNSRHFLEAVSRIARKKPIVAMKTGRSQVAARAAQSHTASLAGSDCVWEAALKQSGVIRLDTSEELGDMARSLAVFPLMKGRRVAIISVSGGLGVLAADVCCQYNLDIARLSPATLRKIRSFAPAWQDIDNPLDIWPSIMIMKYPLKRVIGETIDLLVDDPGVDAIMFIFGVINAPMCTMVTNTLTERFRLHGGKKPIVCCLMGTHASEVKKHLEDTGNAVVFPTLESAARALGYMARYSAFRGIF